MENGIDSIELKAMELYQQGFSIRDIAEKLTTNKSSVGRWVKGVKRLINDKIFPFEVTNHAFVSLIKQIQSKSFDFDHEFYKSSTILFLELLIDLMHGIENEDQNLLFHFEKEMLLKLSKIIRSDMDIETIKGLLFEDMQEAYDFYEIEE